MNGIQKILDQISSFGKQEDGGFSRPFGSLAYRQAADCLCEIMKQEGLKAYIDPVGNVHGIYSGDGSSERELLVGSHLDTVQNGGAFDGLYGIAAGVWAILQMKREGRKLPYSIHLIATNGEEGNILGGTFGSRCLVGHFTKGDFRRYEEEKGFEPLVLTENEKHFLCFEDIIRARMDFRNTIGYLELHIEQGMTLEREQKEIGIVTGIVGLRRYQILVKGQRNHSGTTKMEYRDDALVKAAGIIVKADELARSIGKGLVATTQKMLITPNELAVINGEVSMVLEIRNLENAVMDEYEQKIRDTIEEIPGVTMETIVKKEPVQSDLNMVNIIRRRCKKGNYEYLELPSGATHDGNMIALETPVAMIFVPSKDGISHDKAEWTDPSYLKRGAQLLYEVIQNMETV